MSLYVKKNGKIFGPFRQEDVQSTVGQDLFSTSDQISDDRLTWITISEYQERVKDKEAEEEEQKKRKESGISASGSPAPVLKPVKTLTPVLKPVGQAAAPVPVLTPVSGPAAPVFQPTGQPDMMPQQNYGCMQYNNNCAVIALLFFVLTVASTIIVTAIGNPRNDASKVFSWVMFISDILTVVLASIGIKKSGPGGWRIFSIIMLALSGIYLILRIIAIIMFLNHPYYHY